MCSPIRRAYFRTSIILKLSRNSVDEHLAGRVIDQVKAEEFGAFAQGVELTGSIELIVSGCAGVFIEEVAGQNPIDQDRKLTGGGGDSLGFAGTRGQAAIEGTERGRSAREAHRAAAQNNRSAVGRGRSTRAEQAPAGDFVVGCQRQP